MLSLGTQNDNAPAAACATGALRSFSGPERS